jgi:membrane-associated phospholipid phosphatase
MKYLLIFTTAFVVTLIQLSIAPLNLIVIISLYWFSLSQVKDAVYFGVVGSLITDLLTNFPLGTSLLGYLVAFSVFYFFNKTGLNKRRAFILILLIACLFISSKVIELTILMAWR